MDRLSEGILLSESVKETLCLEVIELYESGDIFEGVFDSCLVGDPSSKFSKDKFVGVLQQEVVESEVFVHSGTENDFCFAFKRDVVFSSLGVGAVAGDGESVHEIEFVVSQLERVEFVGHAIKNEEVLRSSGRVVEVKDSKVKRERLSVDSAGSGSPKTGGFVELKRSEVAK